MKNALDPLNIAEERGTKTARAARPTSIRLSPLQYVHTHTHTHIDFPILVPLIRMREASEKKKNRDAFSRESITHDNGTSCQSNAALSRAAL